jgi:hypothetical protein
MGSVRGLAFWLLVAGCRYGFDVLPIADSGSGAPADVPASCTDLAQPVPATGVISGSVAPGGGAQAGTCGGSDSTENVFAIDVPVTGAGLLVATDGDGGLSTDTVLYIRSACADAGTEIACDEDGGLGSAAAWRINSVAAGRYYVFVDGERGASGTYSGTAQVLMPAGQPCTATGLDRCAPELACNTTCMAAGCAVAETLSGSNSYERVVSTQTATNLHAGTCGQGNDGGVRAPEVIYTFQLATAVTNVHVSTNNAQTNYDTLVYVRSGCGGAEIACNDDSGSNKESDLDTGALGAGSYDVFVDGFGTRSGTADVTITVTP